MWCLIDSADLKTPPDQTKKQPELRTLQGMKDDHKRFVEAGEVHDNVKLFNNCLRGPFFDIPLDNVSL